MYLVIGHGNGYSEEKRENKYLIFGSTDQNKQLLRKYNDFFNGRGNKIKEVGSDEFDYGKDYIKFNLGLMIIYHYTNH